MKKNRMMFLFVIKDTEEFKDEDGNEIPTIDRERGTELYEQLKARGLKVFFSHRTLKTGEMFEPQIFAALNSAAAMILLLSNEEYINSVWLKNEWSRYRDLKKKDSRRSFFVVCEKPENCQDGHSSRCLRYQHREFLYLLMQGHSGGGLS